jgi:hypothetical protein
MPPAGRKRKALPEGPAIPSTTKRPKIRSKITTKKQPSTHDSPPSNPLACLSALPDELLLQIIQHLDAQLDEWDCEERHKQARDICLISRRFNRLGNDLLYQSFRTSRGFTSAGKFLRTLIANPALGPRVKQIRWTFEPPRWETETYIPTSADRRLLRTSLKALDIPSRNRSEWVQQYGSGLPAHMLRLILLHTPNVRALYIIDSETKSKRWEPYQKSVAELLLGGVDGNGNRIGRAPTYSYLNRLNLFMGDLTPEQIFSVFHLPSLRILSLVGGHSATFQTVQSPIKKKSNFVPSVTTLRVYKAHMGTDALTQLISVCGPLEHFEFEYFYCSASHKKPQEKVSYPTITRALQRHKKTLKSVTLNDVSDWDDGDYLANSRGKLSSFQDFDKLEALGAPIHAFEPTDDLTILEKDDEDEGEGEYLPHTNFAVILPKSLKELSLTIFEDEEHTDFCSESLTVLHKTYRQTTPNLKAIIVNAHNRVNIKYVDFYLPKHNFRASDIDFKVLKNGLEHNDPIYPDLENMSDSELFSELDYMENFSDADLFDTEDELAYEEELAGLEDEDDDDDVESLVFNMMQEALAGTQHSVSTAMANMMPYLESLGYL